MTQIEALKLALEIIRNQIEVLSVDEWTAIESAIKEASAQLPTREGKQFHTKFNIGDRVWCMKNNKPTEVIISAIEVFYVNTNQDQITYNARNVGHSVSWLDHTNLQEAWLFKSKTELLESL